MPKVIADKLKKRAQAMASSGKLKKPRKAVTTRGSLSNLKAQYGVT